MMQCECWDASCPAHNKLDDSTPARAVSRQCTETATLSVKPLSYDEDDRIPMCDGCAQDASDTGYYVTTEEPL